jgi:aminoglycoside phosphotransferase (APT) family kinase protein
MRDDAELAGLTRAVARLRPDAAGLARDLEAALRARRPRTEPIVCLHYDASVRNALIDAERLSLIDFDDVAVGPPALDLGRVLSRLAGERVIGAVGDDEHDRLRAAVLAGYAELRDVPSEAALRWHTAAATLVVRSRAAISGLKPQSGARLAELLDDALRLVA